MQKPEPRRDISQSNYPPAKRQHHKPAAGAGIISIGGTLVANPLPPAGPRLLKAPQLGNRTENLSLWKTWQIKLQPLEADRVKR